MLAKILDTIRGSKGLMNLRQLSCKLGVEESALRGMIDYLVRKGYLREEHCDSVRGCAGCQRGCAYPASTQSPDEDRKPIRYSINEKRRIP